MSVNEIYVRFYRLDKINKHDLKLLQFMLNNFKEGENSDLLDDWINSVPKRHLIGVMWNDPDKMRFYLCKNLSEAKELIEFYNNSLFVHFHWYILTSNEPK